MTKHETPFVTAGDLIIVKTLVTGPLGTTGGRFVLDTGAVLTTMTHELADLIGYSARDGVKRARVRTAIGSEEGYVLNVAEFAVLGSRNRRRCYGARTSVSQELDTQFLRANIAACAPPSFSPPSSPSP